MRVRVAFVCFYCQHGIIRTTFCIGLNDVLIYMNYCFHVNALFDAMLKFYVFDQLPPVKAASIQCIYTLLGQRLGPAIKLDISLRQSKLRFMQDMMQFFYL
jgi:hypothetical protein